LVLQQWNHLQTCRHSSWRMLRTLITKFRNNLCTERKVSSSSLKIIRPRKCSTILRLSKLVWHIWFGWFHNCKHTNRQTLSLLCPFPYCSESSWLFTSTDNSVSTSDVFIWGVEGRHTPNMYGLAQSSQSSCRKFGVPLVMLFYVTYLRDPHPPTERASAHFCLDICTFFIRIRISTYSYVSWFDAKIWAF